MGSTDCPKLTSCIATLFRLAFGRETDMEREPNLCLIKITTIKASKPLEDQTNTDVTLNEILY